MTSSLRSKIKLKVLFKKIYFLFRKSYLFVEEKYHFINIKHTKVMPGLTLMAAKAAKTLAALH